MSALDLAPIAAHDTEDEWQNRCQYWAKQNSKIVAPRKRREVQSAPLIRTGQGLAIFVDRGCLVVRDGQTHYPQKIEENRFFKGSLDLPRRIVLIDGSGTVTLDALDWLSAEGVNLVRLKWDGSFVSIATSGGQAADTDKLIWQRTTRDDPEARIDFAGKLMVEKIENAQETLTGWIPGELSVKACGTLQNLKERVATGAHKKINDVLGLEGSGAARYFNAWQSLEIKWIGTKRHPIPDEWRLILSRAALRQETPRNQSATHPVNAMLNYAYGMLFARKQIDATVEGYDPTIGIVHDRRTRDRGKIASFALDLMEPYRPIVDRAVIEMVRDHTFTPSDFTVSHKGTVRLNPELAKLVVAKVSPLIAEAL